MLLVALGSLATVHAAPLGCDSGLPPDLVLGALERAERAISELDSATLDTAVLEARGALKCLDGPLPALAVSRLFRVSGVQRFVQGDRAGATADFQAARSLQPDLPLDQALVGPVREIWDATTASSGEVQPLPALPEGWMLVDGVRSLMAPADRRYLAQWVGADGSLRRGWSLEAGELPEIPLLPGRIPVPKPAVAAAPLPEPVPAPSPVPAERHTSRSLLAIGLTTGAVAGSGLIGAAALRARFQDSTLPSDQQVGLIATNRALGYGGLGLGAVGLGFVGSAIVVGEW